jgi:hypothetical protein
VKTKKSIDVHYTVMIDRSDEDRLDKLAQELIKEKKMGPEKNIRRLLKLVGIKGAFPDSYLKVKTTMHARKGKEKAAKKGKAA